jgi:hypothetical protein
MTNIKTEVQAPVKTEASVSAAQYVQPSELCDQQRRSMAYDAFSVFAARL